MKLKRIISLAAGAVLLAGCGVKTTEFKSASGRFSVQTPVELIEKTQTQDSEIGEMTVHLLTGHGKTHTFGVIYVDSPYNLEKQTPSYTLNDAQARLLASTKGKLTSAKPVTRDGHPGIDIAATMLDNGTPAEMRDLVILDGHRLYQFMTEAPAGKTNQAAVEAYLNSAKVEPPPAMAAMPAAYKSTEGNFTITTPVPLLETIQRVQSDAGPLTVHYFSGAEEGPIYMVMYYDSPTAAAQDTEAFLRRYANSTVVTNKGKIILEKSIASAPYPGLEYDYTLQTDGSNFTSHNRLYLAGSRVYLVKINVLDNSPASFNEDFFNSLNITAPTAPPAGATKAPVAESTPAAYTSKAGRFSVMTPIPLVESTHAMGADSATPALHQYAGDGGDRAYVIAYCDYNDDYEKNDPELHLDKARDGMAQQLQGKVDSEAKITVDGHPGRRVAIIGKQMTAQYKIILVGHRMYQVLVMAQANTEKPVEASAFLDSFKLLPENAVQ